jgi:Raf kinase inhibitor-like YbhB/YbcL family protein
MKSLLAPLVTLTGFALAVVGCGPSAEPISGAALLTPTPLPSIQLTCTAFGSEEMIPEKYTCDGADISPPLVWDEPPGGTQSFVLILDNPDAKSVVGKATVHWLLFNLPAQTRGLPEAVPSDAELPAGGLHGTNSEGWLGYVGPCPPFTQRYFFRLYALDTHLDLQPGADKEQLMLAIEGHVLAEGELVGRYRRK